LFEGWLAWARNRSGPGGCLFVAAATELDDRPGPARDHLVATQRSFLDVIGRCVRAGVEDGLLRRDADPAQFAHDLYAVMLGWHHARRLMGDPHADRRARAAFEALLQNLEPVSRPSAVRRTASSHRR
jgi:AcrR family transcriptional regulator